MNNFFQQFANFKIPFLSTVEVYFDLGTTQTRIAIKDKGVVLQEPTYLGYNNRVKDYIFFGTDAKSIVGKTPEFIKNIRPVINGVISDFDAEVSLIKNYLEKSVFLYFNNHIIKPTIRAIATVPIIATEIEQKAVEEVLSKAGCTSTILIEKPLANAAGYNLNIFTHAPNLIVDLGGGLIEMAIISGGGIVCQKTLKNAGDHMNKLIYNYLYLKYGIILGENTCENLKIDLLNFTGVEKTATIRGKSLESGLPKSVRIKSSEIREALLNNFNLIIDGIKELIETSPPETIDELFKRGIILTGGLANIAGIDNFFAGEIKMDVICSQSPQVNTINGIMFLAKKSENLSKLRIQ